MNTQYENLLRAVLETGTPKTDRTGTGTLSVTGAQLRYDLTDSFPLITSKRVHFKSVAAELLWMLSGSSNVAGLHEHGVTIWDEWQRPYSLTNRPVVAVAPRTAVAAPYSGDFSFRGIAAGRDSLEARLAGAWKHMMRRCYDPTHHRFEFYGATGATVHPRWHDAATFITDVQELPHWRYKAAEWDRFELDKDYFGAGQYGPETSVWLRTDENHAYMKSVRPVEVTNDEGVARTYLTQAVAAEAIGMSKTTLCRFLSQGVPSILKGANKMFVGWTFTFMPNVDGKLLRLALIEDGDIGPMYGSQWRRWTTKDGESIDQIAAVIDGLRRDPNGRRHVVSAWNVADLPDMALAPCHAFFQFVHQNGALDCVVTQRSADLFLGVPFNIASYALLTHMVAAQTGLTPGTLVWNGGDCHIYKNHVDQVHQQINRDPRPFPTLTLDPAESIDDYALGHIHLNDYFPHPSIPAPVAV